MAVLAGIRDPYNQESCKPNSQERIATGKAKLQRNTVSECERKLQLTEWPVQVREKNRTQRSRGNAAPVHVREEGKIKLSSGDCIIGA